MVDVAVGAASWRRGVCGGGGERRERQRWGAHMSDGWGGWSSGEARGDERE